MDKYRPIEADLMYTNLFENCDEQRLLLTYETYKFNWKCIDKRRKCQSSVCVCVYINCVDCWSIDSCYSQNTNQVSDVTLITNYFKKPVSNNSLVFFRFWFYINVIFDWFCFCFQMSVKRVCSTDSVCFKVNVCKDKHFVTAKISFLFGLTCLLIGLMIYRWFPNYSNFVSDFVVDLRPWN